jgi:hypothetical protein
MPSYDFQDGWMYKVWEGKYPETHPSVLHTTEWSTDLSVVVTTNEEDPRAIYANLYRSGELIGGGLLKIFTYRGENGIACSEIMFRKGEERLENAMMPTPPQPGFYVCRSEYPMSSNHSGRDLVF